ncbi:uncharacterized protein BP01DRAFT_391311 [Aspergillus saccharolyticus JOP 1030-1]|uniref:N-acetylgalactosaminide beta-1,3-galactosyltransferase n=1 Tax=Aspergillus saccharolyticus JOP 1030-1 TaxID=1450539 RepID=A0A318ZNE3_9EURO|nr:hypothetical protein BP01DRAFT_391311 [Aspergillus saccharolyticus JOP 1030-1]PYH45953.1 hypothetical protein BP01DRAFT_391311 [Aspergillus saccharolyticus JOP 1030-1]
MRRFYQDNRRVPLGMMLVTVSLFIYHFALDRPSWVSSTVYSTQSPYQAGGATVVVHPSPPFIAEDETTPAPQQPALSAVASSTPSISATSTTSSLTVNDVVLMFKTGASVLWKRVPIHLTTSLSPTRIPSANVLLYSDSPETIGPYTFVDILANTTINDPEIALPYHQQADHDFRQNYAEINNVYPGDNPGPAGGWKLDKYKFVPLVQHAGRARPDAKWYIFMEDDAYLFLPNLVAHLDRFDPQKPWYLGSVAWIHGDYFAHGGSGFAISRKAWEMAFGDHSPQNIEQKYAEFTAQHGCGDHILGHVLKESGVAFGEHPEAEESRFSYGFNPEAHWTSWYEPENWCKPVFSWHHTHNRDVARLYELETRWGDVASAKGPICYKDVYEAMVLPYLRERVEWWENGAAKYDIRSSNVNGVVAPESVTKPQAWKEAWMSVDKCEAACVAWGDCVQWSFYEDRCMLDSMIRLGSGIPEGDARRQSSLPWTSGWLTRRAEHWNSACSQ